MRQEQEILKLLLQRLDSPDKQAQIVTVQETKTWPAGVLENLCREGLLALTTPSSLYTCTSCTHEHDEAVIEVDSPAGSKPRFYIQCPRVGRVVVNPEELRQWLILPVGLANIISKLFGVQKSPTELILGRAWELGIVNFHDTKRQIIMFRGLNWSDGHLIQAKMEDQPMTSIFIFPVDTPKSIPHSISISSILRLSGNQFLFDQPALELIVSGWNNTKNAAIIKAGEFDYAEDYRWVRWHDQEFSFSVRRAKVITMLHQAYRVGRPVLSWDQISQRLDPCPASMSDLFKGSKAWGTFIIKDAQGLYRLNLK